MPLTRTVTEAIKKRVAGKQSYKCANKPGIIIKGIEGYICPLWNSSGENRGSFDESGYQIDHIIEHCLTQNDNEDNLQALCIHVIKLKLRDLRQIERKGIIT